MKRIGILDILNGVCPLEQSKIYNSFKEEIKDFLYKYGLFTGDNVYYKVFECIQSDEYMTYIKISEYASINVKGVIKIVYRIEEYMKKILEFSKYKELKELLNTMQ